MKYLVLGNSAAGIFAAEEIRKQDLHSEITILTADKFPSYSRCLTTYFLAGDIKLAQLYWRSDSYLEKLNLKIEYGRKVVNLFPDSKCVITDDSREWFYDKLLIATGASAVRPDIPGVNLPEVFTLRHMQDVMKVNSQIEKSRQAVVIGGGLVSLKSAYALLKRGLEVTVIVSSPQILSQMLDEKSASLLLSHLQTHRLKVCLGLHVKEIAGDKYVRYVKLSDGREIQADFVIVGKGVHPNTEAFQDSGLVLGRGIRVNSRQETNLPDIFAAGDVAETWDRVRGNYRVNATWPNAAAQGSIAGANMAGAKVEYPGSISLNAVDFFGLPAISAGIVQVPNTSFDWQITETPQFNFSGLPSYQRLVWQENILKGYTLVGDIRRAGVLTSFVREGKPIESHLKRQLNDNKRHYAMRLS